jgi:hypothetical protein
VNAGPAEPEPYRGFEQGPIRPPSEARSLLVRVTRNCPWNRCTFCPVYKDARFSFRPVEHVKRDIDLVHAHVQKLEELANPSEAPDPGAVQTLVDTLPRDEQAPFAAALNWLCSGRKKSVFLQDANSLAVRVVDLLEILEHLTTRFPFIDRITSYARSQTVAARRDADLRALRGAGLDRVHIGLESGSDEILRLVQKGATREQHVSAGRKIKQAGMELSEYVMPGLGGRAHSKRHAHETADALKQINPDFIRLRTLAIPPGAPLYETWQAGRFEKMGDVEIAQELLWLIERLDGITSKVKSDHVLNLLPELQGTLPQDKPRMTALLDTFLSLDSRRQRLFQVGRRVGVLTRLRDLEDAARVEQAETVCRRLGVTADNVDQIVDRIMMTYV